MFEIKASSQIHTSTGTITSPLIKDYVQNLTGLVKTYGAIKSNTPPIAFVFLKRSDYLIYVLSALLQMHIPFVLADTAYPLERNRYILEDCGASLIITEGTQYRLLGESIKLVGSYRSVTLCIKPTCVPSNMYDLKKTAYIVYTSGTTGLPKGVVIPFSALCSFITGFSALVPIKQSYTILSIASVAFDAFMIESALPIALGMQMCVASEAERKNPRLLSKLVKRVKPDIMFFTPTTLEMLYLVDRAFTCLSSLKIILVGGEALSDSLLMRLRENTDARVFNVYGPTETTVIVSAEELTNSAEISLGSTIDGSEMLLLDGMGNKIHAPGITGEICISGETLAAGYLNNTKLTNQKFCTFNGKRMYHTGDLGVLAENKKIKYIGRLDLQVKIRGNRVELEEIEAIIGHERGVTQVAVIPLERANHVELAAFFTANDYIDIPQLRKHLGATLPQYMIPTFFIHVENFKLSENGKLDREWLRKEFYNG